MQNKSKSSSVFERLLAVQEIEPGVAKLMTPNFHQQYRYILAESKQTVMVLINDFCRDNQASGPTTLTKEYVDIRDAVLSRLAEKAMINERDWAAFYDTKSAVEPWRVG